MKRSLGCLLDGLDGALAAHIDGELRALAAGKSPDADFARPEDRQAAVALILGGLPESQSPAVLLMHRVEHPEDRWSGQISLPGGHPESEDASLLTTAVREAREEIGVRLESCGTLLGRLPALQARGRGALLPMRIAPYVFALTEEVRAEPGPEAQSVFALPLDEAARGSLDATYRLESADGAARELPSYHHAGHVIWGITHGLISRLLPLLPAE